MEKKASFEYLRVLATLAVVANHVCSGLFNNYSIEQMGNYNSRFLYSTYTLVSWAVPVFLMITGALLLNLNRIVDETKIRKYLSRMFRVLLIFGGGYAVAEQIFDERAINAKVIFDGILNMIQGNSWSHMWYVYMLISMYFITIPLRAMITSMSVQGLKKLIYLLIIGHVLVTTLNDLTGLEIYKFMQFSVFIMYYLLGYYLCNSVIPIISIHKSAYRYVAYALLVISIIRYAAMFFSISMWGKISDFAYGGGILEFCQSVGLFVLLTGSFRDRPLKSKILYNISRCSFTIYLIHPFLINLLYKIIKVSPMNFPIVIGIGFISIVVFVASWLISNIMVKVPELNKIL